MKTKAMTSLSGLRGVVESQFASFSHWLQAQHGSLSLVLGGSCHGFCSTGSQKLSGGVGGKCTDRIAFKGLRSFLNVFYVLAEVFVPEAVAQKASCDLGESRFGTKSSCAQPG